MDSPKEFIAQLFNRFGYTITANWRLPHSELCHHLAALFSVHEINVAIDVGANRGQYRDLLRCEMGYKGRLLSFEPVHRNFEVLRERSREDRNWEVHQLALGRREGVQRLNVMKEDGFSSFLQPDNSQTPHFSNRNDIDHTEDVKVCRLDALPLSLDARCNIFLKVDTQGFDADVVAGAEGIMSKIKALQLEVSVIPIYEGVPDWLEVISTMKSGGLFVTGIYPVSRTPDLRAIEFDCVFSRKAGCPKLCRDQSDQGAVDF